VFNRNVRGGGDAAKEIEISAALSSRRTISRLSASGGGKIPKLIMHGIPDFQALLPGLKPFKRLAGALKSELHRRGDRLSLLPQTLIAALNHSGPKQT